MRPVPLISFGLSIILCICAITIALSGGSKADARTISATPPPLVETKETVRLPETIEIVIAAADIDASTRLSRDLLTTTEWPADRVPSGAVTALSQIDFSPDGAPFTNGVLVQGEPLLSSKLVVHPPRRLLSQVIPAGMRAISIAVREDTAVSGFVLPGDYVDVTAFARQETALNEVYRPQTIVRGALILAADQTFSHEAEGALPANTVTLALTPRAAADVMAAARSYDLGLSLIGREEAERLAETQSLQSATVPPRRAKRPAPLQTATRPQTREITVVHGNYETQVTAPAEPPAPIDVRSASSRPGVEP